MSFLQSVLLSSYNVMITSPKVCLHPILSKTIFLPVFFLHVNSTPHVLYRRYKSTARLTRSTPFDKSSTISRNEINNSVSSLKLRIISCAPNYRPFASNLVNPPLHHPLLNPNHILPILNNNPSLLSVPLLPLPMIPLTTHVAVNQPTVFPLISRVIERGRRIENAIAIARTGIVKERLENALIENLGEKGRLKGQKWSVRLRQRRFISSFGLT